MNENKTVELLCPAGEYESLKYALAFGADAVYIAGKQFGMRTSSKNFDEDTMRKAVAETHSLGKKVYVTCNTVPKSKEIDKMPEYLQFLESIGTDALIIADLGVLSLAKKYAPNTDIHISTQAGIVNYESANMFYNLGAKRVVLARELSFDDIADLRAKIPKELETEAFVHGAMCVSFSGRCLISYYMTGRDANRGDCAQPCRWKYRLYEENREGQYFPVEQDDSGTFLYNSRDMCMIDYIPELIKSGINSLKIEGRAKSSYYSAVTANAYRHAIDDYLRDKENYHLSPWIKDELNKISHREYSTGFYLGGEPGQVLENGGYIRNYTVVAISEGSQNGVVNIIQKNKFCVGDELDVLPPGGIPFTVIVKSLTNEHGESVESAPHAMEKLKLGCGRDIPAGSLLRMKI
ncbi:MAG: U32 family peptidase [Clostridiales bacterium]|nr:U32 family peptidase [Clostridiales bacterium]